MDFKPNNKSIKCTSGTKELISNSGPIGSLAGPYIYGSLVIQLIIVFKKSYIVLYTNQAFTQACYSALQMTLQVHVKIPRELGVCILFVVAKYVTFQSQLTSH